MDAEATAAFHQVEPSVVVSATGTPRNGQTGNEMKPPGGSRPVADFHCQTWRSPYRIPGAKVQQAFRQESQVGRSDS